MKTYRLACLLALALSASTLRASKRPEHPYRYSVVDLPVSLVKGSFQTPAFTVHKTQWYWIMVQIEKPLPLDRLKCMLGTTMNRIDAASCTAFDPLLQIDWKVVASDGRVDQGSNTLQSDGMYEKDHIYKFLGRFPAKTGENYILQITSKVDGSGLAVANPHLIVVPIGSE